MLKIFFTGDIVLRNNQDKIPLLKKDLQDIINQQDIVCGNLEGPIVEKSILPKPKRGATIKQDESAIKRLKESGFNMLSLANNHIMDYGEEGLRQTLENVEKEFLTFGAGISGKCYHILKFTKDNKTYGFLSIAEGGFGVSKGETVGYAWMLYEGLYNIFQQAKRECDYFFVICHCGAEDLDVPLPEVKKLYHYFIDLGATAVIGHHPHVIQGYERYKGKMIFYSLGNFIFDLSKEKCEPYNSIGMCVQIVVDENIEYNVMIVKYDNFQVDIYNDETVLLKAMELLKNEKKYNDVVNKWCIEAYNTIFRQYYSAIVGLDISNRDNVIKFAKHRLNGDKIVWDDLFLYHNIVNETNRWICERAIKLLGKI